MVKKKQGRGRPRRSTRLHLRLSLLDEATKDGRLTPAKRAELLAAEGTFAWAKDPSALESYLGMLSKPPPEPVEPKTGAEEVRLVMDRQERLRDPMDPFWLIRKAEEILAQKATASPTEEQAAVGAVLKRLKAICPDQRIQNLPPILDAIRWAPVWARASRILGSVWRALTSDTPEEALAALDRVGRREDAEILAPDTGLPNWAAPVTGGRNVLSQRTPVARALAEIAESLLDERMPNAAIACVMALRVTELLPTLPVLGDQLGDAMRHRLEAPGARPAETEDLVRLALRCAGMPEPQVHSTFDFLGKKAKRTPE